MDGLSLKEKVTIKMAELWHCRLCRKQTVKQTLDDDAPSCLHCGSRDHMIRERETRDIEKYKKRRKNKSNNDW